ncbi:MAG: branched-chain amino acid ABC transporter permease [Deltaproteobacteria bacterium]|nr:branched-chain amino acid ABC transporter permease [Deltaproteobacteria bacterium]
MTLLLQLLVNGVAAGGVFALFTVGFALVYSTTRVFHVAHGAIFTVAAYATYAGARLLGLPLVASAALATALAMLVGVGIEAWAYRPLRGRGAGLAALMIGSFGVYIVLQSLVGLLFGTQEQTVRSDPLPSIVVGGVQITALHLSVLGLCLVLFTLLQLFLTRTSTGNCIRALADNPELAAIVGIDTSRLYLVIAALGAGLAGLAAPLTALDTGIALGNGFSVLLLGCVATIVGGVGHLPGAGLAAFLLGIVQNLAVYTLSPQWQDAVVFVVLGIFLVARPEGLFGEALRRA